MTRKGQPKVRTGCLTCKSRKVKCDEAKPACARCTGTGRRCEGYAVVVPSNRAIARARSRTTRLKDALAQARAGWEGGSEKATLEYFTRDVAPKLPQNLENQFWTVAVPRMSKSEPAIRHAMAAIGSLFPQRSSNNPSEGGNPQADAHYSEALRLMARKVAPEKDDEDGQSSNNKANADSKTINLSASVGSLSNRSSPSPSSVGLSSTIQSPASLTPGVSNIPEVAETDRSDSRGSTNPFASPQSQEEEGDDEPTQYNDVDVVLSCCILFIATEFLRGSLEQAMQHLANGINILNNVDYDELDQTTLDEIVPKFHRLSIIQLCFHDKPGFPSLNLQHGLGSRYNLGPFDKSSSIYLPKRAVDPIILDAIRYIRSADPGSQTDSRLASKGPVMSEEQKSICASFDRWHAAFLAFVEFPRKNTDQPLPKHQGIICAETEMKYQTAKICISVCRSHDESVYDYFKDLFGRIVTLAKLILDSCPDITPEPTDFKFDFMTSYLPLLEFVIAKCRWLDIRYEAWLIAWKLATGRTEPVTRNSLHLVAQRMIEREHNVKIEEVTRENAGLFSLPAEEMRVKDYTADARFADLVTIPDVDMEGPAKVQVPYTQRLLLRCGSCELDDLAGWMENKHSSS
ncbi:putative transcriptional regulatory protein [Colletotrichum spaethianum]|uniref:Transcriptional regulatory protein n=1 Tax=Colletotrichum spaethianum TaxID=700344 RepID=A0AA37P6M8_9PEZI|nr:putative transcriptional regulatory protein [Colletotrichum spaethianum]GKT46836.1 putative transcriptional regulatory protein [Colletotrichum spaethianum]